MRGNRLALWLCAGAASFGLSLAGSARAKPRHEGASAPAQATLPAAPLLPTAPLNVQGGLTSGPGARPAAGSSAAEGAASAPAATTEPAAAAQSPTASEPGPAVPPPPTFELLLQGAAPAADLETLLAPLVETCAGDPRPLDGMRCRSTRAYLRKEIPRRAFAATADDPAALSISAFDASIKGYHLAVTGCLACSRPIAVGRAQERRFVTLKTPDKAVASLPAAVEISHNVVGFDGLTQARAWLEQSGPDLRAQFVFRTAGAEWSRGSDRGYALTLLGFRVFNRCTGDILISRPPSTGVVEVPPGDDGCRRRRVADTGPATPAADDLPPQLSKNDISQAMTALRPQVFACFERFKVPGLVQLDFVVARNGTVGGVRLSGAFNGTPTGACALEAAKNAHFPRSARDHQEFQYPFFLRP